MKKAVYSKDDGGAPCLRNKLLPQENNAPL